MSLKPVYTECKMKKFSTIEIEINKKLGKLVLNRPEKHNAMNALMISEIREGLSFLAREESARIIIISANGESFSSGADLNYMMQQAKMPVQENLEDSRRLAKMFYEIYTCPKPVITFSSGVIAGGANGIVAASDYALTMKDSAFRFSEVHLGLVPATIAPYVTDRIGRARAMELLLSGRPFSGEEAERYNLVNKCAEKQDANTALQEIISFFMKSSPGAMYKTKGLLLKINNSSEIGELINHSSEIIAGARASEDGQEGIKSFFERRNPNWTDADI